MSGRYIRQEPYVNNHGIYIPDNEYVPEGCASLYKCIITKEMFIEAYDRWIQSSLRATENNFVGVDDADDWCD